MSEASTWVGLDVHKSTIQVAILQGGSNQPLELSVGTSEQGMRRLKRQLGRLGISSVRSAYEAGPSGFSLQRQLLAAGIACQVVAPSKTLRKPGDRVKTDRRDARHLAEHLRAGLLTEVRPPSEAEEAVRDLCRGREALIGDRLRLRHRITQMLLRRGVVYPGRGGSWTERHRQWLWSVHFEQAAAQAVWEDLLLALDQVALRLGRLDELLESYAQQEPYRERVGWLCCLRGIKTLTAMTILAELHGFERFTHPRHLMGFLGLVPSEDSTGQRRRRGEITKAGNAHVRRVLIEAAHHSRHRPNLSQALRRRQQGQPARVIALANKAQQRLHRRYHRLLHGRGKLPQKVVTAVARELVGFIWAILTVPPEPACSAA